MNKKIILFCCSLLSSMLGAQETLSIHTKSYPATPIWNFICENYAYTGTAQVQIAKTEKGGLLKIVVDTNENSFTIAGNLYIDLTDMSAIVCTDKNMREVSGNQIVSYYTLTPTEMNRLKSKEMQSVRFAIKGKGNKFSSQTGYFTAINKKTYFATAYDDTKKSYETAAAISELYKK